MCAALGSFSSKGTAGGCLVGEYRENGWLCCRLDRGEPAIETISGANNILTQGLHQTRLLVTSLIDPEFPGLEISVFPNPTNQWLNIASNHIESLKLSYQLYDISGRNLLHAGMFSETEIIDMKNYAPNIYILKIISGNGQSLQVFKIIKT
jgi:hypothetical protein